MATTTGSDNRRAGEARIITWWSALAAVLLMTAGGFLIAYIHASGAADAAARVAQCLNSILGDYAPLVQADHDNEKTKIAAQRVAIKDQKNGIGVALSAKTPAEGIAGITLYERGIDEFRKSLDDWTKRDNAITAEKRRHPLGRC